MRAFVTDRTAPSGVVERVVSDPVASAGRLVVEVHATSLNRGEIMHVAKYRALPDGQPMGWDFAGVVAEAATDGTGPSAGSRVFGWSPLRGTWADRVAVDVAHVAPVREGLAVNDAAALGVAALTALAALGRSRIPLPGASVVATGATGGVGAFTVQLAALAGAFPVAAIRADGDPAEARALLPAGIAIEQGLDPEGPPADLIVESVGGSTLSAAFHRVGVGGTVVTLGRTVEEPSVLPAGWFFKNAKLDGLTFAHDFTAPGQTEAALGRLGVLVAAGRLRTSITSVVSREDLPTTINRLLHRKVRGKVVVRFR